MTKDYFYKVDKTFGDIVKVKIEDGFIGAYELVRDPNEIQQAKKELEIKQ